MNNFTFNFFMEKSNNSARKLSHIVVLLLMTTWGVNAAIKTAITGGTTTAPLLWTDVATWGGALPVAGDDIVIPNGAVVAINLGSNTTAFGTLTIQTGGVLQSTGSSSTLTISAVTVDAGGVFNPYRTGLTVNGPTNISGTMYCEASTSRTDIYAGNFTLNTGSIWTVGTSGGTSARTADFQGNFINNASTFTVAQDSGVKTFSGTGKVFGGTTPTAFIKITITGTREISVGATLSTSIGGTTSAGALTLTGTLTNKGTLNIAGSSTPTTPLDATFTGNTVNYNGVAGQTVMAISYVNLGISNAGTSVVAKSIGTGTTISGAFSISGSSTATIATGMNITVGSLLLASVSQVPGTYGSSASSATNTNSTYFTSTATGIVTVPLSGSAAPTLTADTTVNTVDNTIDITFTDDASWRAAVTAVKIGTTALTATTDYVITAGNLQLKPSGLNILLTTAGAKTVTVVATGYLDVSVNQIINFGVPTANSTSSINSALALGFTRTISCIAKDQYNNLVSGYTFKYDAAITNANSATAESYTIDTVSRTSNANDISLVATTNTSGVATFDVVIPGVMDLNDGISIQVQLTNGTTNVGSPFTYTFLQQGNQTITFGALSTVIYGAVPFNLTATSATSGTNPITYTSSNTVVATISGNTVTIVGAGTTNITASQAGNATYSPAVDVIQSLIVNVKPLTLATAFAANKVYNGTNVATITGTLTGVINADDVTVTLSGTFADVNVGTVIAVTSTSTLGGTKAGNYSLTQPTGLFADITIAPQTITFATTAFNYQNFANYIPLATSATSATNPITFTSSNPAVAIIVAGQIQYVGIGVTTITASQVGTTNYSAATAAQTLTILPTPIAAWNFWTATSTSQTTKQAYIFNSGLVTASSADFVTRGAGAPASGGTSAFRTSGFPLTTATETNIATAANMAYFQTTIQAAPGKSVSLSTINARFYDAGPSGTTVGFSSTPGASSQFGYSLDGGTTVVPITTLPVVSTSLTMAQLDLSGIPALQNVPAGTTITLRYYASGQSNRGWGFGSPTATSENDGLAIGGSINCLAPTVYNVTGSGTDCLSIGVPVGLSGSQVGYNYQLVLNGVNVGSPIAGTSSALSFGNQMSAGNYVVAASNAGCTSTASMTGSAIVNLTPNPTVGAISTNQTICSGTTLSSNISIANATGTVQWQRADDAGFTTNLTNIGTNSTTLTIAQVGNLSSTKYFRAVVSNGTCTAVNSGAVLVTVNTTAAPTGATTQSLSSLLTIGSIVVTGTNVVWYASSANAAAGINPLPSITPLTNTTYYATQTVGGCASTTSLAVTITTLANQDFDMTQFSYYPNPVNDMLNLSYSQDMNSVKVFNMVGQELLNKEVNASTVQIDLSSFANGAYFIQVTTGTAMKTVRVIKR
jgi:hypothetical protein